MDRDYGLDEIGQLRELQSGVEQDDSLTAPIDQVVQRAIVSRFYFELVGLPWKRNGKHFGRGKILCSILGSDLGLQPLLSRLSSQRAQMYLNGEPIAGAWDDPTSRDDNGNFCRCIGLETTDHIDIAIRLGSPSAASYPISGLPSTIAELVHAQGLNACFGTAYHRKRKGALEDNMHAAKRRKSTRLLR
jgi:hypothetical protein